ncbi:hypothetical protein HGRIS_005092 [Hohenbuehelia grisea]|uniref:Amine oxidase n=1 Tax=Hohenbuehelia grisea TaxID=104357 RepID=A0ABR3JET8_9AGAR
MPVLFKSKISTVDVHARNIAIVGAGVAGLYSALLLQQKNVNFHVFEAQDRVGGRIWTHRFTADEDQFFEAGAMRIPKSSSHESVLDLIRSLNAKTDPVDQVETIPYILNSSGNRVYVNKRLTPDGDHFYFSDGPRLTAEALGFNLPEPYAGRTAADLLESVLRPYLKALKEDFDGGFTELLKYDGFSFRLYLSTVEKWPAEVIDFVEVMFSQTNQYTLSFTEIVLQNMDFFTEEWFTIKGGMDRLPQAMAKIVGADNITLGARITSISYNPDGRVQLAVSRQGNSASHHAFDDIILAIPPASLKRIDRPRWSHVKESAIRSAHFEPLFKLGMRFKTRFWERVSTPALGGQSITDLRSRWVVYPSNGLGSDSPGVLLTYTWMSDASYWLPLSSKERIDAALADLAELYEGEVDVYEEFIEGKDVCWQEQWATGDAMFYPGQLTAFAKAAAAPEGNVYFAGEHLSRHHTWIAGAIDSALSTVRVMMEDHKLSLDA